MVISALFFGNWGVGKLTASCGRGSSSTGGLRGGWLSSDGGAARDAILVGQVGGGLAVTLGAGGLAVSDGVHGVGEELALGAAGVVGGRACEVVRICCGKRDGELMTYKLRGRWWRPADQHWALRFRRRLGSRWWQCRCWPEPGRRGRRRPWTGRWWRNACLLWY